MSVGYTCPHWNPAKQNYCPVHKDSNFLECREQGDPRPFIRNTKSKKGNLPGGDSALAKRKKALGR